ncbi:MAG: alpha/beta fold hydrolase [Actinobacteria bacterium]|nr:alpha/beta fold hydrolase [Actinomycetota bacterium]
MPEPLLLLHGFTQTGRSWDEVVRHLDGERYRALAPDIRGHGAAATRRPIDFASCVQDALSLMRTPFTLAGYSQGGRLALHIALARPDLVTRLVLVSTTAGIEDDDERARRREADAALAAWLEAEGRSMSDVAERWGAQPLFATQSPQVAAAARADRLANEPAHLAAALRGIGTGAMAPLWERLADLEMPAVVLAGERDEKSAASSAARSIFVSAMTARLTPRYRRICRCSSVCGIHPSSAATMISARSIDPTPATMFLTKSSWPGTSTMPRWYFTGGCTSGGEGRSRWANPRSMVMPRAFSSGSRSGSVPVSARTRELLPWSTCPAVARM